MANPWFGSPGDTISFECPPGSSAIYKSDQLIPNEKDALLYVISEVDGKYLLGPVRAGKFEGITLCTPESAEGTLAYELMLPPQAPQAGPPLTPLPIAFPWIWFLKIVLGLVIATTLILGSILWWRRRRLQTLAPKKAKKKRLSPKEAFESWIQTQKTALPKVEAQLELQKDLYFEGFRKLRLYLESYFEFYVPGATSKEFIVELKTALLVRRQRYPAEKIPENLADRVESLVSQCDNAVYAKTQFDPSVVKAFVEQLKMIFTELQKLEESKSRELS